MSKQKENESSLETDSKKISNLSSLLQKGKNNPLNINISLLSNKDAISNLISKKQNDSQKKNIEEKNKEIPPLNFNPKTNFVRGIRPSTLSRTIKVQKQMNMMEKLTNKDEKSNIESEKNNENYKENINSRFISDKNLAHIKFSSPEKNKNNKNLIN